MELRDYIKIISRRKWIIISTFVVTIAVVAIGTYMITPIYQASTTLRIAASAGDLQSSTYGLQSSTTYNDQLMNTYVEIATSTPVLQELMKQLNTSKPLKVQAQVIPNTELIKITVEDTDPRLTATAANALANILVGQNNLLYTGGGKTSQEVLAEQLAQAQTDLNQSQQQLEKLLIQTPAAPGEIDVARQSMQLKQNAYSILLTQYQQASIRAEIQTSMITIVEPAVVPLSPSQPRIALNLVLGIIIGLLGGAGLAFIFENLDTRLYTMKDIENASEMTVLAEIPKANKKELSLTVDAHSPLSEACRSMAGNILQANQQVGNVFLVSGAEPGQGTTTIVSNLAIALAEYGKNVVAVDCNAHLPKLHKFFNLSNEFGLMDVLKGKINLKKALQKGPLSEVSVLANGENSTNRPQSFASTQMAALISELSKQFDYVLLDVPALLAVADSIALTRYADGLILVVRAGHARREAVYAAKKIFAPFHDKFVGIVVNQQNENGNYNYRQYRWKPASEKESADSNPVLP